MIDFIDDNLMITGNGLLSAMTSFHQVEEATKVVPIDLSISGILTPLGDIENGCLTGAYLPEEPEMVLGDNGKLSLDIDYVQIKIPKMHIETENFRYPILVDGYIENGVTGLWSDGIYLTGQMVTQSLIKHFHLNSIRAGIMRDIALSTAFDESDEELVYMIVRASPLGVKKAVGCFFKEPTIISFDEVRMAIQHSTLGMNEKYEFSDWEINQRTRKLLLRHPILKTVVVEWSDIGFKALTVIWNDNSYRTTISELPEVLGKLSIHEAAA